MASPAPPSACLHLLDLRALVFSLLILPRGPATDRAAEPGEPGWALLPDLFPALGTRMKELPGPNPRRTTP